MHQAYEGEVQVVYRHAFQAHIPSWRIGAAPVAAATSCTNSFAPCNRHRSQYTNPLLDALNALTASILSHRCALSSYQLLCYRTPHPLCQCLMLQDLILFQACKGVAPSAAERRAGMEQNCQACRRASQASGRFSH